MVPTNKESDGLGVVPHRSFKIKANFGTLRIGFVEPTIWKTWRKSGRINADAERFMVSRPILCCKPISTLRERQ
jgi:amidase